MEELRKTFHEQMDELRDDILRLGSLSGTALNNAMEALNKNDESLADKVISNDDEIDNFFIEIEKKAVNLMAQQNPVASDLRFLLTIFRISLHLERIGDLASNIALMVLKNVSAVGKQDILNILNEMHNHVTNVLNQAINSFAKRDKELALELHRLDDPIDDLNLKLLREMPKYQETVDLEWVLEMVLIGRWLERIADQAVVIGDQVRYLVTGDITE